MVASRRRFWYAICCRDRSPISLLSGTCQQLVETGDVGLVDAGKMLAYGAELIGVRANNSTTSLSSRKAAVAPRCRRSGILPL